MNRVRNALQIGKIQNFFSKKRFRTPGKGESMTKENEEKKREENEKKGGKRNRMWKKENIKKLIFSKKG